MLRIPSLAFVASVLGLSIGTVGCAAEFEWKGSNGKYFAAEDGQKVELRCIEVRDTASPWNAWESALVEPCDSKETKQSKLPCFPKEDRLVTQDLLSELHWNTPGYR